MELKLFVALTALVDKDYDTHKLQLFACSLILKHAVLLLLSVGLNDQQIHFCTYIFEHIISVTLPQSSTQIFHVGIVLMCTFFKLPTLEIDCLTILTLITLENNHKQALSL